MDFYKLSGHCKCHNNLVTLLVWAAPFEAAMKTLNKMKSTYKNLKFKLEFATPKEMLDIALGSKPL